MPACKVARRVRNWDRISVGDRVRATIEEVLTVYLGSTTRSLDARVLAVDPSYRLLTLQYPNGTTETLKVGLRARMQGIEAGDEVAIRPLEVRELRVQRHWNREQSSPPSQSAPSAR